MVKIAHPVAHELGITRRKLDEATQQLAAAMAEIEVLKDEVARLRQHVPPEFNMRPRYSARSTLPSNQKGTQSSIPRYARATQASEQRSAKLTTQPQNQTTTFGTVTLTIKSGRPVWDDWTNCTRAPSPNQYQYRDGSLIKMPTGYLKSTKSSKAKLCPKIWRGFVKPVETPSGTQLEVRPRPWWEEEGCASASNDDRWATYERENLRKPWSLGWLINLYRSPHKLSDTEYRDLMDLVSLLPATRLEDDELKKTSLKHMLIDDGIQARLLVQGRELAQRCFWNLAEEGMPGQNPWTSWRHVRFEWGVLSERWGDGKYFSLLGSRASQSKSVWDTIQKVINLRHTTSHYSPSSSLFPSRLDEVDKHLENVQKMAIQLYDKTGALQARRLRDELRQAARNTFDEITALAPLVALPFAGYPWKDHHESVFTRLLFQIGDADAGRQKLDEHFPKEIGRIAEDWSWQSDRRGRRYEPPVSLAACRRTPPKRRHSASSYQASETSILDLAARIKADREWQQRYGWDTPYDVPEWLIKAHEEGMSAASPRARRRLSHSS